MAMSHAPLTIRLNSLDNVVIARVDILAGTAIVEEDVTAAAHIPRGHKIAVRPIGKDEAVTRYGQTIGFARAAIAPGDHVHIHNCEMRGFERDYAYCSEAQPTD